MWMNPKGVQAAVNPDELRDRVAQEAQGRCTQLYVLNAAKKPKFLSNREMVGRYTVAIVTAKVKLANKVRH